MPDICVERWSDGLFRAWRDIASPITAVGRTPLDAIINLLNMVEPVVKAED